MNTESECKHDCQKCDLPAINPIYKIGDRVSFDCPVAGGHGMKGTITETYRCVILGNGYQVQWDSGIEWGTYEKNNDLKLIGKEFKLTDFIA
jgi:hypothetical protein